MTYSRSPKINSYLQSVPQSAPIENIPLTLVAPMSAIVGGVPTATPNKLYKNVNIKNYKTLFGASSIVSKLYEAAYAISSASPIWVYPLADLTTGTAASTNLTIAGTATSSGKIKLTIEGKVYETTFLTGDTNIVIATALYNIINANTELQFVISNATGGEISLSHKQKGIFGNYTSFKIQIFDLNGIETSCGLTTTMNAFSGGVGLHDISQLSTADGILNYQTHIFINYNILKDNTVGINLIDFVNSRKNVNNKVLNGRIFSTITDDDATFQNLQSNVKYVNENIVLHKVPTAITGESAGNNFDVLGVEATMSFLAMFNSSADVTQIKIIENNVNGTINNAGRNMSGIKIPSTTFAIDPTDESANFDDVEIDIWSQLGVNVWNVVNGRYELMNEGLTSNNADKNYQYFSTVIGIGYWQQREFAVLKEINANAKSTQLQVLLSKSAISKLLEDFSGRTIFNPDMLTDMLDSVAAQINASNIQKIDLIYSIAPTLPLKEITSLINVNTSLDKQNISSTIA